MGGSCLRYPGMTRMLAGTTDTPLNAHQLEPKALEEEIKFILDALSDYLTRIPTRKDVLSVFAGLRPLAAPQNDKQKTKEISRSHKLIVSDSGLITITGGKWTTYRQMAEETVNERSLSVNFPIVSQLRKPCLFMGLRNLLNGPTRFLFMEVMPILVKALTKENHCMERNIGSEVTLYWMRKSFGRRVMKWQEPSKTCSREEPALCFWMHVPPWIWLLQWRT